MNDFTGYLAAKKKIDDRALNRGVWERLAGALPDRRAPEPLRVLEIGAGIGTMIERMAAGPLRHRSSSYTAVDIDPECTGTARRRLKSWAENAGFGVSRDNGGYRLKSQDTAIRLEFKTADAYRFAAAAGHAYDALLAHAFWDLVDIPTLLPGVLQLLSDGGLLFFSLNFDGDTVLLPAISDDFDERVIRLYHRSMDERIICGRPSGHSRTGRRLLLALMDHGTDILAAGASDWVVYPRRGRYGENESCFLHHIVHTIDAELTRHPEIDADRFKDWIARRQGQIENGELVFMAHHLDILARKKALDRRQASLIFSGVTPRQ
ncbi:MAG: class I SAM-dependent methyltransferase [Desulfobacterales bacterium]